MRHTPSAVAAAARWRATEALTLFGSWGDIGTADVGLRIAPLDATIGWRLTDGEAQDRAPTLAETATSHAVSDVHVSWQPAVRWARRSGP